MIGIGIDGVMGMEREEVRGREHRGTYIISRIEVRGREHRRGRSDCCCEGVRVVECGLIAIL